MTPLEQQGAAAKAASYVLASAGTERKNEALEAIAKVLTERKKEWLEANRDKLQEMWDTQKLGKLPPLQ